MNSDHPVHSVRNVLSLVAIALGTVGLIGCPDAQKGKPVSSNSSTPTAPALTQPSPAPAVATAPTPGQQRAQQLMQKVERAFSSGQDHYRKGELLQAKSDFNSAVDMMLASGLDLKADPQLDDEFNRVVDAVNALEMEAIKQGNGFNPKIEPSPADVANDVTFEVDPNLVAKAKGELATTKSDLPLVINDYVAAFINFFANTQKGHNTLMHSFQRAGRYKAMIQRVLGEEGVPQDLIYLAVAESSFQPQAVNGRSGAGGMWQFMPHGDYGLARNTYVDERFDPEKSTRAYARYMKFNYNQLGDWYLAMAGYNWGAGNVQRAVQKTGYADFWELYKRNNLPGETKNYVPEILAAIIIANNPTQYGFENIQLDPPVVNDTIPINYSVDLRLVADIVNVPVQDLLAINPSLLRLTTPPPGTLSTSFDLHLPPGTATAFQQNIAAIPEGHRTQWRYHRIAPGDTLAAVAHSFHVPVELLATTNQLEPDDSLASVQALVVPVPPQSAAPRTEIYKARKGESLVTIADRFGVSLQDLHRWNHTVGSTVLAGQRIRVAEPVRVAPSLSSRSKRVNSAHTSTGSSTNSRAHGSKKTGSAAKSSKTSGKNSHAAKSVSRSANKPASKKLKK